MDVYRVILIFPVIGSPKLRKKILKTIYLELKFQEMNQTLKKLFNIELI